MGEPAAQRPVTEMDIQVLHWSAEYWFEAALAANGSTAPVIELLAVQEAAREILAAGQTTDAADGSHLLQPLRYKILADREGAECRPAIWHRPWDVLPQGLALPKSTQSAGARRGEKCQGQGLVFAKAPEDWQRPLELAGAPLPINNLAERLFDPLIKQVGVTRIRFHDLRHTATTLALMAGVPVKVVSQRLGHAKIEITMDLYNHVLPEMQQEAAQKVAGILNA